MLQEWINFYSHSDPIMWLNLYPPFSIPNPFNITWNQAAVFQNATQTINRTRMIPGVAGVIAGLRQEHNAYWVDRIVLQSIMRFLL